MPIGPESVVCIDTTLINIHKASQLEPGHGHTPNQGEGHPSHIMLYKHPLKGKLQFYN